MFSDECGTAVTLPGANPIPGNESADTPDPVPAPEPERPDVTTATISDVADFAPTSPPLVGEPEGLGVVGMPTNFVVEAETHTVSAEIFDVPVQVRFTPVSYLFVYGDGTARESTTAGREWSELGVPQFTATETSHSYDEAGAYTARVDVRYAAAGDAGFGWFPIDGLLTVPSATAGIRVVEVETALVERTCQEDPGGPGC